MMLMNDRCVIVDINLVLFKCYTSYEDLDKMEELGKKMLKYCGGLPLAVVVLGGILRTKRTLKEWNEVHVNIKSYLDRGEKIGKEGEVPKVLAYSYYDLPWQLKPCFLYLGKFKEDSDIEVASLYQMWIGEGMIFENDRREQETMVDVAERYLEELAKRCMVEIKVHEDGKHAVTRLESCRLHDLMRDLCLAKAKEENLYKLVDQSTSRDSPPAFEAQYGLVLHLLPEDISKYNFLPKDQTKHLRTFLCDPSVGQWECFSGVRIMSQVKNLKMLRVLAILSSNMASQRCYFKSPLRYVGLTRLRLSGTKIEEDPMGTLEKLPGLRRLVLGRNSFLGQEMICRSMGFPQLKHLELNGLGNLKLWKVDDGAMPKLLTLGIDECEQLEMIPDGLRCLTTLKDVSLARMPEKFNNRIRMENGQQGVDYDKISNVPSVKLRRVFTFVSAF
ncbi:probable disease resistance RPP8-like protein 2 [Coffea eugenioides]|uniref:probable disease resistance RPP8-like protein 2 n=1 Tax=Coffea eugenioides TaxID=49369 RepID=UPI000F6058D2|nr:probable disease resistance RPP8-like protein 2 [Coffea eugenioides]